MQEKPSPVRTFFSRLRARPALELLCAGGLTLAVYAALSPVAAAAPRGTTELLMAAGLGALVGIGAFFKADGRAGAQRWIALLIAAGLILRLGYMLYTPYDVRCHDLPGPYSHTDYMRIIAETGLLPQNNGGEFYHPPLMYLLGAAVLKIAGLFTRDVQAMFNAVRVIPGFASCASLLVAARLYRELGLSGRARTLAVAVTAFHPAFIYLSSSVNNDMLSTFLMVLTVELTVRWYRARSVRRILPVAVSFGLGMMTKLSVGVLAVPVGAVMVYSLAKDVCAARRGSRPGAPGALAAPGARGRGEPGEPGFAAKNRAAPAVPAGRPAARQTPARVVAGYAGQFAAFLGVGVPLSLWYPLRNLLRFGQSFGYICPTVLTPLDPRDMLLRFPVYRLFQNPFNDFQNVADHNSYVFLLKTAMFTELSYPELRVPALLLTAAHLALIVLTAAAMAVMAVRLKRSRFRFAASFLGLCWAAQTASYVGFVASHPVFCSSDFRYLVLTVVTGAAFLGMAADTLPERLPRAGRAAGRLAAAVAAAFCLFSCLYYVAL